MNDNKYDLIVIGAGPCGVMAAIQATERGKKVLLIDKNSAILRKLSISGNGRCNLTNNKTFKAFIDQLSNKKFLYHTIKHFDAQAIIHYFNSLNIALKEEDNHRIFPESNRSDTIVDALTAQLKKSDIILNTMVKSVKKKADLFVIKANQQTYCSKNLLLACGGQTYPQIGVGKDAYLLARAFDHTIKPLVIEECPIKTKPIRKGWQGISLSKVTLNILEGNKRFFEIKDALIFTHFGLSGPAVLNSSFAINKLNKPVVSLNMLNMDYASARKFIYELITQNPKKYLKNQLTKYIPQKIIEDILNDLEIIDIKNSYLNKQQIKNSIILLTDLRFDFKGFYQPEYAFLTGSGVDLNEINSKTLESKLVKNLYFGGEILDGCGPLGGYNITIALACGHLIGNNIE